MATESAWDQSQVLGSCEGWRMYVARERRRAQWRRYWRLICIDAGSRWTHTESVCRVQSLLLLKVLWAMFSLTIRTNK